MDLWSSGALKDDQLSVRQLGGGKNQIGALDVLVCKREIMRRLIGTFMDNRDFAQSGKDRIRELCTNVQTFRKKCGYAYNTKLLKVDCRITMYV